MHAPSIVFGAIAFGYSWAIWSAMCLIHHDHVSTYKVAAMFGPAIACVVVRRWVARDGIADAGPGGAPASAWAVGALAVPVLSFAALAGAVLVGQATLGWNAAPAATGTLAVQ